MEINDLIHKYIHSHDKKDILNHFKEIIKYDRYQASEGIWKVANYFSEYFSRLDNFDSKLHSFSVKNGSWWTFSPPISWSPSIAKLLIKSGKKTLLEIDHLKVPCSLATNSSSYTNDRAINSIKIYEFSNSSKNNYKDSLVLIPKTNKNFNEIISELEKIGALGFITSNFSKKVNNIELVGRIELNNQINKIFGFSITEIEMTKLINSLTYTKCYAIVNISIDNSYSMPVFESSFKCNAEKEIWIIAHMCHPRPAANDNTSGLVGIIEIANKLNKLTKLIQHSNYKIRLITAPEFSGIAAYLKKKSESTNTKYPEFVINLDMIGENLEICGSEFYIERPPSNLISFHQCLLEYISNSLRKYLKNRNEKWSFKCSKFLGYSDHALFVDPHFFLPSTLLTHYPDLYNHSSGDTIDKVDLEQLNKITLITTIFIIYCCNISYKDFSQIAEISVNWIKNEFNNISKKSQAKEYIRSFYSIYRSLKLFSENIEVPGEIYIKEILANIKYLNKKYSLKHQNIIFRNWSGPFNPKKFIYNMSDKDKNYILSYIHENKIHYSILLHIGIMADSKRSKDEITEMILDRFSEKYLIFFNKVFDLMIKYNLLEEI